MPRILDLGISDEEYLQLIAQGRDPVREHLYAKNLIRAGVPKAEAYQAVPLLAKSNLSTDEEAFVKKIWQIIRSR